MTNDLNTIANGLGYKKGVFMDYRQFLIDYWDAIDKGNAEDYHNGVDPKGFRAEKHIAYLGDYDDAHLLNLYYPEDFDPSRGKLPTVIYIHGGGWMYGSVDISERYLGYLASQGFAVMGMNYRLLQRANLQEEIYDIFSAMHWLGRYGSERGFDLNKVLVCGDSAGGHLSLLATSVSMSEELLRIYGVKALPYRITAVSVSSPVTETSKLFITDGEATDTGIGTARAYLDMMLGKQGTAAPWNGHMSASETIPGPEFPPVYIIDSEMDSLKEHTGYLIDTLEQKGCRYEKIYWSREEGIHLLHVFNVSHWEWKESLEANNGMLDFFKRVNET